MCCLAGPSRFRVRCHFRCLKLKWIALKKAKLGSIAMLSALGLYGSHFREVVKKNERSKQDGGREYEAGSQGACVGSKAMLVKLGSSSRREVKKA